MHAQAVTVFAIGAIAIFAATTPRVAHAQTTEIDRQAADIGTREYIDHCAVCHGSLGKGDGPLAAWMKGPVADLTVIQKSNNGIFPFDRVYRVIDGREAVAAHGTREMPVWGKSFSKTTDGTDRYLFEFLSPKELESFVRGRIVALVGYVYSLQEK